MLPVLISGFLVAALCANDLEELARIAAVRDEHDALISSGFARYSFKKNTDRADLAPEAAVWFSGKRFRIQSGRFVEMSDGVTYYFYTDPGAQSIPSDHVVVIQAIDGTICAELPLHPAWLGHCIPEYLWLKSPWTIADAIRRTFLPKRDPITLTKVGALVRMVHSYGNGAVRLEFLLDPARAYSLIEYRLTAQGKKEPVCEAKFEYDLEVKAPPWIAQKAMITSRTFNRDKEVIATTVIEARLLECRLEAVPEIKFSINDLGLPKGARLRNAKTGEETLLGVDAPTPEAIDREIVRINEEFARGPLLASKGALLQWSLIVASLVALLLLVSLAVWQRRCRQAF